jgi:hypothetical protein
MTRSDILETVFRLRLVLDIASSGSEPSSFGSSGLAWSSGGTPGSFPFGSPKRERVVGTGAPMGLALSLRRETGASAARRQNRAGRDQTSSLDHYFALKL